MGTQNLIDMQLENISTLHANNPQKIFIKRTKIATGCTIVFEPSCCPAWISGMSPAQRDLRLARIDDGDASISHSAKRAKRMA